MKQYFTIEELCESAKAKEKHIDNTPPDNIKNNLKKLIDFLNPLREKWGSGIKINSGYRCNALNKEVKGQPTSAHLIGFAVDMWPVNNKFQEFCKFVLDYLDNTKSWDQCIIEKSKTAQWLHFGLYNQKGQQRKMKFNLNVN